MLLNVYTLDVFLDNKFEEITISVDRFLVCFSQRNIPPSGNQ